MEYRQVLNTHALLQVLRPICIPNVNLATYPFEILYSLPQPLVFVPQTRQDVKRERREKDINNVYMETYGFDIEKPPKYHWLGNPV